MNTAPIPGLRPRQPLPRAARYACTAIAVVWLTAAPAAADWLVSPFVGVSFAGDTNIVDLEDADGLTNLTYGGQATWLGAGFLGVEGDLALTPGFFERDDDPTLVTGSSVFSLSGNLVIAMPLSVVGESLRPYASGGLGLLRANVDDRFNAVPVNASLLGINVGGGAIGFLTNRVGVRWDLRYFKSIADKDDPLVGFGELRLSYWRATMGVVFRY